MFKNYYFNSQTFSVEVYLSAALYILT
jgi:hypothetical protein